MSSAWSDLLKDGSNTELEGSSGRCGKLSLKIGYKKFDTAAATFDK